MNDHLLNRQLMKQRSQKGADSRSGFSLLEVLLSMAILVGAIAVLGELMSIGLDNVEEARDRSRAQLLAEGIMDQVLAGLIAAQATPETSVPEDLLTPDELNDRWVYSIELNTTSEVGMSALVVSVTQTAAPRADATLTDYTMTRWMIDPAIMDEMAAAESEAETAAASSTGGRP